MGGKGGVFGFSRSKAKLFEKSQSDIRVQPGGIARTNAGIATVASLFLEVYFCTLPFLIVFFDGKMQMSLRVEPDIARTEIVRAWSYFLLFAVFDRDKQNCNIIIALFVY